MIPGRARCSACGRPVTPDAVKPAEGDEAELGGGATENGEELAKVYTRVANRERQAEITNEIMEVVGGAEALREKEEAKV